jgi:hypothetical protein
MVFQGCLRVRKLLRKNSLVIVLVCIVFLVGVVAILLHIGISRKWMSNTRFNPRSNSCLAPAVGEERRANLRQEQSQRLEEWYSTAKRS